jgi:uncharacterized protein (DUF433 family)
MSLLDRIAIDPQIRFGKPCVRGTRISVGDLLGYLAGGMSEDAILQDFPQIEPTFVSAWPMRLSGNVEPRNPGSVVVRVLFDEQLSESLVRLLQDPSPDAVHVRVLGIGGAGDEVIWQRAVDLGCVLVTKDEDFHRAQRQLAPRR